ncbi:dTMP kinase [Desulfovibrio aerotolerans]|uniref:Thymidylate kinase n=1 Tax=Solidesulfovibrio aerotolerans TaxID=295255 RepID=A0A7C9N3V5_9BACT|nr:dTMP kinase [Solidesulfovibrio aerotolerans]
MFVTFEGVEGSGKSTQIGRLCAALEMAGRRVALTRQPGGCELGRTLRAILLSQKSSNLDDRAELFLYLADRAQHVAEVVRPALAAGQVVVCDRYVDSTVAYQGYGRGLDVALLTQLNEVAVAGLQPDLTLLLDLDAATGLTRAVARNDASGLAQSEGRFEAEHLDFHTRVRQGYLALAAAQPARFVIIDAAPDPDYVAQAVWQAVAARLA